MRPLTFSVIQCGEVLVPIYDFIAHVCCLVMSRFGDRYIRRYANFKHLIWQR